MEKILKDYKVNGRELVLGLLFILFCIAISVLLPLAAPVFSVVLIISGIYGYKHSSDAGMRTIAVAAIIGGIMLILIVIFILLSMVAYTSTSASIENYAGRIS